MMTSTPEPTVFVVDDEPAVCKSLERLISSVSLNVETYSSAQAFLDAYDPARPGCLILDIRMPGMNGLELQKRITELDVDIPIIFVTGFGDIPMAIRAMKNGAVDFIEKPFKSQLLLDRIHEALRRDAKARPSQIRRAVICDRIARLSPREHEVLDLLIEGKPVKQIAAELDLRPKTVYFHQSHIMEKLEADTLVEVVRYAQDRGATKGIPSPLSANRA